MELVSAIETFDQLFVRTEFFAELIEVLESDDRFFSQDRFFQTMIVSQQTES